MKLLSFLFFPALLFVFMLVGVFYISSEHAHRQAEIMLSEKLGAKVTFNRMSLKFKPEPALSITEIIIHSRQGNAPFIVAKSIMISPAIKPLIYQNLIMINAFFESMRIHFQQSNTGETTKWITLNHGDGLLSLDDNKLLLSGWNIAMYDGEAQIDALIYPLRNSKKLSMDGQIVANNIQIAPLLNDSNGGHKVSGSLSGKLQYSASFYTQINKSSTVSFDGSLHLHQGLWLKNRLPRQSTNAVTENQSNKQSTPYKNIDMVVQLRNHNIIATAIRIYANHFYGMGKLHINQNDELHGEMDTSIAAGIIGTKMLIRGTITHPNIYPAPSATIAGVMGGVFGGPVGVALGIRLGGIIGTMLESTADVFMGMFKSNPDKTIK